MKSIALPVLIIVVGVGWLLTTQHVLPGVNWVWVLGIGCAGVLTPVLWGVNKLTMVVGPWLIIATVFSLLRQSGKITLETEVPCLVITLGIVMLIVQMMKLPHPDWLVERKK
ncbi:MAG TPA: hypothetical protein VG711_06565 [Phycisphaerales bacterium]|nr:hypothetical protein [Phycisphaerales bacterium]